MLGNVVYAWRYRALIRRLRNQEVSRLNAERRARARSERRERTLHELYSLLRSSTAPDWFEYELHTALGRAGIGNVEREKLISRLVAMREVTQD